MNAPEPLQESLVDYFPIDKLHPCPTNPRHDVGDVAELAASIARMGMLQPILIRTSAVTEGEYQVISGHRRLAAATMAGLEQVPCRLCDCNDEQVAEIQIVENLQRKDLTPLQEAAGYERLMNEFGHSAEQIGERVGKSRAYVYAKLKLLALHQAGRAALAAGQISESIALLVARIPSEALQAKAIKALTSDDYRRDSKTESMSFREAKRILQNGFTTDLRKAIWSLDDDTLVAEAGSCNACPKRSGNSPEDYPDVTDPRICMDPTCYAVKREAKLAILEEQAEKKGKVVPAKEAAAALYSLNSPYRHCDFVELSSKPPGQDTTWNQLARQHGIEIEREIIVDKERGKTIAVARSDQLKAALAEKGVTVQHSWEREDDDGDDAFEVAKAAFYRANAKIMAADMEALCKAPSIWLDIAERVLMMPAERQLNLLVNAGLEALAEHATGWNEGARRITAAVEPDAVQRLIVAAQLENMAVGQCDGEDDDDARFVFVSPEFDAACAEVGINAPLERSMILEPAAPPDPSDAAQAADQTAEPAVPAKPKRARKAKGKAVPALEETPEQVGSADVDEGAEVTHG
jgi:ParB/RepB/Spo0J family partition protein